MKVQKFWTAILATPPYTSPGTGSATIIPTWSSSRCVSGAGAANHLAFHACVADAADSRQSYEPLALLDINGHVPSTCRLPPIDGPFKPVSVLKMARCHPAAGLFYIPMFQRPLRVSVATGRAQPRDGAGPKNTQKVTGIVSPSPNRVTGPYPVT